MADGQLSWGSQEIARLVEERRFAVLATVISAPEGAPVELGERLIVDAEGASAGALGDAALEARVRADMATALRERKSRVATYQLAEGGEVGVFLEILEPQPQLLVVGAGHIAVPLAHFGKQLGFEVVVVDDREKYANRERFPDADQVIAADFGPTMQSFPITPATYVVIITRAHTYDEETLRIVLDRPWAYLGVIGSRRRVQTVLRTLGAEGYDQERLRKVRAPIGLDIGAETPEEIALSIIAEVVLTRRGGTGQPLSSVIRPISLEAGALP